jgi:chloramphenicol 3-O phosphotransferase
VVETETGQIIILNGAPRSGKSSILGVIQETFDGVWMNLGVDLFMQMTPKKYHPSIGLRPGEEQHPVYALVPPLYAAMFEAVAAMSRAGMNVVVDVGMYRPEVVSDCARRLEGLPVLFVGVRCPIDEVMRRREATWGRDERVTRAGEVWTKGDPIPEPVMRWQEQVHGGWTYDLEVDTSILDPGECAAAIRRRLEEGPGTAFAVAYGGKVDSKTERG